MERAYLLSIQRLLESTSGCRNLAYGCCSFHIPLSSLLNGPPVQQNVTFGLNLVLHLEVWTGSSNSSPEVAVACL